MNGISCRYKAIGEYKLIQTRAFGELKQIKNEINYNKAGIYNRIVSGLNCIANGYHKNSIVINLLLLVSR